jgi:hypothetical protein
MASVGMDRRLGLSQPVGTAVLAAITVNSTFAVLSGRGVEWRGRRYGGAVVEAADDDASRTEQERKNR